MDDSASTENPQKDFNKLDLTQLQGFSFGTQWTQDKSAPRDARRDDHPRRDDGRRDAPGGADGKRDRRGFRKPAGPGTDGAGTGAPAAPGSAAPTGHAPARDGGGEIRAPRGEYRGGPRRDGPGGDQRGGPRFGQRDGPPERDRGPYLSPYFNITFYPEDIGFTALAKAIRTSCRTYELFEIARVIIGKNDRFVAVVQRKPSETAPPPVDGAAASAPKLAPLAVSVPDGLPFESEEAGISHVLSKHLGMFFDSADVEVDPPKGNFQVVNKCGVTGELLGPPNYHRYNQIVQQHFATRVSRMPFEAFRSRIETVRDPEIINQWLEKMKKTTRYTWKLAAPGETPLTFDSLEDARTYLLTNARDKVVKPVDSARFHGKTLENLPQGEIRRAVEGTLERQRRFPLDTANALRGRLRREGFTIFKKGSKGVSYVCAVKRKFRVPAQTFSDSIGGLISFIESNPMVKASELPTKLLGIQPPPAPPVPAGSTLSPIPTSGSIPPIPLAAGTALTPEDQSKLNRLNGDLRWLVTEGYVTEFIDGRLFAPPPMTEARKQEVEKDEHDPENFPEVPRTSPSSVVPTTSSVDSSPPEAVPVPAIDHSAAQIPVESTEQEAPKVE